MVWVTLTSSYLLPLHCTIWKRNFNNFMTPLKLTFFANTFNISRNLWSKKLGGKSRNISWNCTCVMVIIISEERWWWWRYPHFFLDFCYKYIQNVKNCDRERNATEHALLLLQILTTLLLYYTRGHALMSRQVTGKFFACCFLSAQ